MPKNTLKPPSQYLSDLQRLRDRNKYARDWVMRIEKKTNRHPETNGGLWGWYEVFPLGVTVGYWGTNRDDLKDWDIPEWNRLAAVLSVSSLKASPPGQINNEGRHMNKKQFIHQEIEKNKRAFGRWHSTKKRNAADPNKLISQAPPKNEEEALQHGNALANTGNYPVGTSGCFNVGISGGCGPGCFVYLNGDCEEPQEMIPRLDGATEINRHVELYGQR